jgi:hypothetical protein
MQHGPRQPRCHEHYLTPLHQKRALAAAWSGFCGYLERICAMQATDGGARDVSTMTFPRAKGYAPTG